MCSKKRSILCEKLSLFGKHFKVREKIFFWSFSAILDKPAKWKGDHCHCIIEIIISALICLFFGILQVGPCWLSVEGTPENCPELPRCAERPTDSAVVAVATSYFAPNGAGTPARSAAPDSWPPPPSGPGRSTRSVGGSCSAAGSASPGPSAAAHWAESDSAEPPRSRFAGPDASDTPARWPAGSCSRSHCAERHASGRRRSWPAGPCWPGGRPQPQPDWKPHWGRPHDPQPPPHWGSCGCFQTQIFLALLSPPRWGSWSDCRDRKFLALLSRGEAHLERLSADAFARADPWFGSWDQDRMIKSL